MSPSLIDFSHIEINKQLYLYLFIYNNIFQPALKSQWFLDAHFLSEYKCVSAYSDISRQIFNISFNCYAIFLPTHCFLYTH